MTRRDLFKALGAAFAAPVAASLAKTLPLPKPVDRHWAWLKFSGFKPCMDSVRVAGQIYGQRSDDGQLFYVSVALTEVDGILAPKFENKVNLINDKLSQAMVKMNGWLDPRCTCSSKIIGYSKFVDHEGIYGEPGEVARIPIHPYCELHNRTPEHLCDCDDQRCRSLSMSGQKRPVVA